MISPRADSPFQANSSSIKNEGICELGLDLSRIYAFVLTLLCTLCQQIFPAKLHLGLLLKCPTIADHGTYSAVYMNTLTVGKF